jgi:hypothetical protein
MSDQNYLKSKIYLLKPIVFNYNLADIYIGATTLTLQKRFNTHRAASNKSTSRLLFNKYGAENIEIVLLEEYPCNCKTELHKREAEYIRSRKCINKSIPNRKPREYYQDNRLECIKRVQNWTAANKDHYNSYMKTYMNNYRLKKRIEKEAEVLQPF